MMLVILVFSHTSQDDESILKVHIYLSHRSIQGKFVIVVYFTIIIAQIKITVIKIW